MSVADSLTVALVVGGVGFITLGTVGLLRFADVHSRLHALTKADNVGLGLIILGLVIQAPSAPLIVKLLTIWLLVMLAATTNCYLIARSAEQERRKQATAG